jgi:hypothetical protein
MKHPQMTNTPKTKKSKTVRLSRAQVRAPIEEVAEWMRIASKQGRSLSNWLRQLANEAVRVAGET